MNQLRAWVEIDVGRWRRNFAVINADRPSNVRFAAVLKDEAYGHGAVTGAGIAGEAGAAYLAVVALDEALALRSAGIDRPILMLGQRMPDELEACLEHKLTCCLHEPQMAALLSSKATRRGVKAPVHVEIDTGMSRYGARWTDAVALAQTVSKLPGLELEGVMSHFAMSDELDKAFANLQRTRFQQVLDALAGLRIHPSVRHICNSGGFLDLPQAHYDMVRMGILPLGVYPSQVCRRIPGLEPVMSVKSRIAQIQNIQAGDNVGYGMRYTAPCARRIAVLPIGYGDGFPRVRNEGAALIGGKRAPLIGGVSMDAITVDITEIPEARIWDEAVVMGTQGNESIDVHELAALKRSVSYDVLANWRGRLRRVYLESQPPAPGI